jgi:tRNA 5-methylaminomethyl-2-thiouridine biosynthesis bifunctional protein
MAIVPARLAHTPEGVLYSSAFADVYHSRDDALGQAHAVFLAGNGLPQRWQGRERFTIVETGFGAGLNFLATWAAWRADPQRCARLHFVSCEREPFRGEDLALIHARWPNLAAQAAELQAQWPVLAPGVHRLDLDHGRVTLTLHFGDAAQGLAQLAARADAFYLDGFAPARNPELWTERIFHLLARLAAPHATLATWSAAGAVREGLRRAGFATEKAPGFGTKWQMLRGHLASTPAPDPRPPAAVRHALVIGAGIAGCTLSERLGARGWRVDLIERSQGPAGGASGNLAGVLRPLPSVDDNRMSRLTRAGSLFAWRHIQRLQARGFALRAEACGVLHLARDRTQEAKMRAVVDTLALPPEHLHFVAAAEAAAIAGCAVASGGWWFAGSGWVQPPSLCAASIAAAGTTLHTHFGRAVARLMHADGLWHALAGDGTPIASAPVVILAPGVAIGGFEQAAALPVARARGQVSHLPAATGEAPRVVVCRGGYVSPAIDGLRCAGATFAVDDAEPALRARDHAENLERARAMLPGFAAGLDAAMLGGRVGFRPASPDRLPMVGALPSPAAGALPRTLAEIPRHDGLYVLGGYGARGLVWSALAAELLASRLEGDPLPLEGDLCDAIDPARFVLRPRTAGQICE